MKSKVKTDSSRTQINKAKILKCLKNTLGNVRLACKYSKVGKSTFYDWYNTDKEFAKALLNVYRGCENVAIVRTLEIIGDDFTKLVKVQKKSNTRIRKSLNDIHKVQNIDYQYNVKNNYIKKL